MAVYTRNNDAEFRIHSKTGSSVAIGTAASGPSNQNEPVVAAMPDGTFAIAWDDEVSVGASNDTVAGGDVIDTMLFGKVNTDAIIDFAMLTEDEAGRTGRSTCGWSVRSQHLT